ncbi:MAG: ABC transporter permease [Phycisphaerales bacterium]|nr:ABC transporter permease [Phycisphaerales bacterium]
MTRSMMRLTGFLRKEFLQIRRDPSSIALALVMPVVLLLVFGYGVSFDAKDVPVAVVLEETGPSAREVAARFEASPYFKAVIVHSMDEASELVRRQDVDAIVRLRSDFDRRLASGSAPVQLVVNGVDANQARLVEVYARGVIGAWAEHRRRRGDPVAEPPIVLEPRIWFNDAVRSTDFLVPGLLTLVMTLIGVLLTALVIAREWERGTMEAILATPLRTREFLLGKLLPYFLLGMGGMALSVALGIVLFGVPLRGSFAVLAVTSALFLLASLGLGLFLSAQLRGQFVAAQAGTLAGFLPALFLSGLLFDLDSTPRVIQFVSHVVPARYFVAISQTVFLAGDVWSVVLPNSLALAGIAILLLLLTRMRIGSRLDT